MAKKQRLSIDSQQAVRNSQVPYFARRSTSDLHEGTGESYHAPVVQSHEPPEDVTAADRELEEALDRELWECSADKVKEDIDVDQKEEEEEVPKNDKDEDVEDKWDDNH